MDVVSAIIGKRFADVQEQLKKKLDLIWEQKQVVLKRIVGARLSEIFTEILEEGNIVRQGRVKLIRRRIRKGKVQRNIRKSAVRGFTLNHGKLKRIPASRRIHMKIVQRRAARKRKSHLQSSLRKRKISLRKRKAMGIKE